MTKRGMVLQDLWDFIEKEIFPFQTSGCIFNQYSQVSEHDLPNGDRIRRDNLRRYLSHFKSQPNILLVGEAAGYRGCRFSAIPFTSEAHLLMKVPVSGQISSRRSTPWVEPSAKLFWYNLKPFSQDFFVWNALPFHPYQEGNLLSNRTPTKKEFADHGHLLAGILGILKPAQIAAIGKQAESLLLGLGHSCTYVRHPSYGGKREFEEGLKRLFLKIERTG
jgi:uracil-DNA glycosylase